MIARATTVAIASLALANAAHADVLFDNFGPEDAYALSTGWTVGDVNDIQLGAGFVMNSGGDYHLETVTAAIRHVMGPNVVTLSVYDTDDGAPGNLLEKVSAANLPAHDGEPAPPNVFEFSGETILKDGQTYWVIASTDSAGGSWLAWNWNIEFALGLHAQRQGQGPWQVFNFEQAVMRVEGTPAQTPKCPADLTGNGSVGVPDLLALLAAWGPNQGHPADLTGNGSVGVPDLLELLAQWGPCGG